MMRRVLHVLTAASLVCFATLFILAAPSFFDAEVEVINSTSEAVSVVAEWQSGSKNIGRIESQSSYRFSVEGEAAISFRVRLRSGREIETEPLYFSSGIKIIAEITSGGVDARYDHET